MIGKPLWILEQNLEPGPVWTGKGQSILLQRLQFVNNRTSNGFVRLEFDALNQTF